MSENPSNPGNPAHPSVGQARSAVVSGSSRGIGRAIAQALALSGCAVCLNYANPSSAPEAHRLADELSARYGTATLCVAADVSQESEAQRLVAEAHQAFGRLDILVNNAGITRDGLIARMREEDFDQVIAINLKGAFNCCKAATGPMMKQRFGRIINMGSIVGVTGNAGQVNYAASKAGLVGLSKSLAKELAVRNITVNVVAPGFIETDMTRQLSEAQQSAIRERIASRRFGTPEEVAALVSFLASDAAGYITGQVIGIDGGMS
ncbi:MAG: 3-oxoacyl-[acyl-carrier-protein] reductase [Eggerthellaceae bacterium]|nr:3-oxoacyl-[acyl-carrier-protein] reductase [Eggerthellaceae bacterium]